MAGGMDIFLHFTKFRKGIFANGHLRDGAARVELNEAIHGAPLEGEQMLRLDDAMEALTKFDPRKAKVVELRFFGGLSVEETAEVMKISAQTVMRDWKLARVWLAREMEAPG